jgi:tetratricopeptide (TPR) repeat protein
VLDQEPIIKPKPKGLGAAGGAGGKASSSRPLIRIDADGGSVARPGSKVDAYKFYEDYYRTDDKDRTDPDKLRALVQDLNQLGRFRDAHAALHGYLKDHPKLAEPWMYEAYAWAADLNRAAAKDEKTAAIYSAEVKKALNYAADLAQYTHNPNHLFSVADKLFFKGYYERVGALLDETMPKVPHRAEPVVLSINLARKLTDPIRMAESIERLLSLGWPGQDEYLRVEARNQVEAMAKTLREQDRGKDADALLRKLTESEARDVFVRLSWDGEADFDIAVEEPLGITASYTIPRTVYGGSLISNGFGSHPEEAYVCPRGFDGNYTVSVSTIFTNPSKPVTRLTLETIVHEGTAQEKKETHNLDPDKPNKPVVVKLIGGRRTKVLPFIEPLASTLAATPLPKKLRKPAAAANRSTTTPNRPPATGAPGQSKDAGARRPSSPAPQ